MGNLFRYYLLMFIVIILNGQSYAAKNRCDTLKEVLFSDYFKVKFRDKLAESIIDEILEEKCPNNEQTLYKFSMENPLYRKHSLGKMAENRMHSFISFLYKYGDSLDSPTLFTCIVSLNSRNPWTNDSLLDYITHLAVSHPTGATRITSLCFLLIAARLEDCKILAERIGFEPEENIPMFYYRALVRFSSLNIDSVVSKHISLISKYDRKFFSNIEEYNRYDFLPELYTLRERLKKEENPLKKNDANDMLVKLEEVIPNLEKKKTENAPIGLPLDWGVEKKDGKVKTSNK